MYRFALRPWWVVSHVVVVALIVAMVNLGLWQLRRLDEARDRNDRLAAQLAQPPRPVDELLPGDEPAEPASVVDRRVTAAGEYRSDEDVLIRGRSLDGSPGSWVVVPLELADGRVVAVNRGWIRNDGRLTEVPDDLTVPEGRVRIEGIVQPSHERGTLGASDPGGGRLESMARLDLDRLDRQVEGDLLPVWIQLSTAEDGAPDPSPRVLPAPSVDDDGPHLSYAAQWFIFAAIAAFGYPFILRRTARERGRRRSGGDTGDDSLADPDAPDPDDRPAPGDPRLDAPSRP